MKMSWIKESNETIAYKEGEPAAGQLERQHVQGEGLLMCGARQAQYEVDDGQVVYTNLVLVLPHPSLHGDESEHAQ